MNSAQKQVSYKDTLNLPRTDFPLRPQAKLDEADLLVRWQADDLYKQAFTCNKGQEKFILHDGPPYANGAIHLGHAYNKILKDMLTKAHRMMGYHVPITPGWDCHGLPIELKVSQENPGLNRADLKKSCRVYAQGWIEKQKGEFKKLGIIMDWDNPYSTMTPDIEASTVRAFGKLVSKGYIERKNKTVAWCPSCQTTLASAEIEYKDRKDPSLYVLFPLTKQTEEKLFGESSERVSLCIWTTTPWTLALNRAILAHPTADYVLLDFGHKKVIVGGATADALCSLIGVEKKIIKTFSAIELQDALARHPFLPNMTVPLIFDDSIGTQEGTAFVHCAPGCGPIDYEIGVKNKLEIYSPITPDGRYSEDVVPQELVGLEISKGQGWAITQLIEQDNLLYKGSLSHSYPHCWRCLQGLIFRATPQWFFNLEKNNVQKRALEAIEKISFLPEQGKNFLKATVAHRWEWCLSRQRVWGIPIPALLCKECDFVFISPEFIEKIAQNIETQGIEYWEHVSVQELIADGTTCVNCNRQDFAKEQDILDVWFDSGVTHYSVLLKNPELTFPADVYLEGVDQHRGWFQSSLLTSIVLEEEACTKTIMSHGYTVDAKGQKMSKSKGNVILPEDIINQIGTDGLRLWVASIGLESDPIVSPVLLQNVAEVQRKIRNTCRFLLSVLYDFNKEQDALAPQDLLPIDRRALESIYQLNNNLIREYKKASFTGVAHELADYCTVELSARYFDIIKDRLYVEEPTGRLRRSAQTACWHILDTLTKLMAPIFSFTAELVADAYQKNKTTSIHLQQFTQPYQLTEFLKATITPVPEGFPLFTQEIEQAQFIASHDAEWTALYSLRSLVLKAIELLREQGIIKQSMEAHVTLFIDFSSKRYESLTRFMQQFSTEYSVEQFLKEFFIVSGITLTDTINNLNATAHQEVFIAIKKAEGEKCPRCWQWDTQPDERQLCRRCAQLVL